MFSFTSRSPTPPVSTGCDASLSCFCFIQFSPSVQGHPSLDLSLYAHLLLFFIILYVFVNACFLTHIFFRSNTLRTYIHRYPFHFSFCLIFVFFGVEVRRRNEREGGSERKD